MRRYEVAYRVGLTPWERYPEAAAGSIERLLDRESATRPDPPGRALDLGCGRGIWTAELARRGWDAVGVDNVAHAVEAARRSRPDGATFVLGDVTALSPDDLGRFHLFLDIGCFQGLDDDQRAAAGHGVTRLAESGATLLMLAFGPTRMRRVAGGVSRADVEAAFPHWEMLAAEPADTAGLGWPLNRTSPQWYRLRRLANGPGSPA